MVKSLSAGEHRPVACHHRDEFYAGVLTDGEGDVLRRLLVRVLGGTEIERASVEVQTQLVAGSLASEDARAFLAAMPTVDTLMPPLSMQELEAATATRPGRYSLLDSGPEDDADEAAG